MAPPYAQTKYITLFQASAKLFLLPLLPHCHLPYKLASLYINAVGHFVTATKIHLVNFNLGSCKPALKSIQLKFSHS